MADEHESKIVITGEDKGATNTLKRIVASFARVTEAVRGVMRTLGLLNWAVNGYHKPAYLAVWKLEATTMSSLVLRPTTPTR